MKAIDRTNIDAVGEFAFDTVFGDYKSHNVLPRLGNGTSFRPSRMLYG